LFPGLTVTLLVIAGAIFVRDRRQAHVNHWTLARRVLIVLTIATALISASAVLSARGARAVRHSSLVGGESHQAAYARRSCLRSILALHQPRASARVPDASVIGFYAGGRVRDVAVQPGTGADADGQTVHVSRPYTLLMYLPGFNSLRVPARFWMTVTLCLAVIGAMVFARLTEKLGRLRLAAPRRSWRLACSPTRG
jgi:hypothetical protein